MALTTRRRALTALGAAVAGSARPARRAARSPGEQHVRARCGAPTPTTTTNTRAPSSTPSTTASAASRPTSTSSTTSSSSPTTPPDLDPARTLESLYLDPLAARVKANHGSRVPGLPAAAAAAHRHQDRGLVDVPRTRPPPPAATSACSRRTPRPRPPRPGHRRDLRRPCGPYAHGGPDRTAAFYDGRLTDLGTSAPASFVPLISDNWTLNFTWLGVGAFPEAERRQAARHRRAGPRARAEGALLGHARPGRPGPRRAVGANSSPPASTTSTPTTWPGLEAFLDAHRAA